MPLLEEGVKGMSHLTPKKASKIPVCFLEDKESTGASLPSWRTEI